MSRSAGSPGKDEGSKTAVAAIAGVIGTVRTKGAKRSSQERIGIVSVIRSFSASQLEPRDGGYRKVIRIAQRFGQQGN